MAPCPTVPSGPTALNDPAVPIRPPNHPQHPETPLLPCTGLKQDGDGVRGTEEAQGQGQDGVPRPLHPPARILEGV